MGLIFGYLGFGDTLFSLGCGRLSEGKPATNVVSLSQLSAIERSRLKDSLRAIGSWQDKAAYRYQAV